MKESQKLHKSPGLVRVLKKLCYKRVTVIPIVADVLGTILKGLGIGEQRKNRDHLDHSAVKIYLNILKSSGDPKRLAVNQTCEKPPVKIHTRKEKKYFSEIFVNGIWPS